MLYAAELGDGRLTELLATMQKLMGSNPALLKKLFLSWLPVDVKRIIVANGTENIDELARRSDLVLAVDSDLLPVNTRDSLMQSEDTSLNEKDKQLTESVDQLLSLSNHVFAPSKTAQRSLNFFTAFFNFALQQI